MNFEVNALFKNAFLLKHREHIKRETRKTSRNRNLQSDLEENYEMIDNVCGGWPEDDGI